MPLLAIIDEAAFTALADETVLGKDSFIKDEKTNTFRLALDGAEAGKLAIPLQNENKKLAENNAKLLDEKIKTAAKVTAFEKLGKTPEEIDTILKEGVTADTEKLTKEFNQKIDGLKTENQRLLDAARIETEAAATAKAETEKQLISTIKQTRIAEAKNKHDLNGIADHVLASHIDVVFDADLGKYVERVIEKGEVAYKGTAFKTVDHLVEDLRANKEYAGMFNAGTGAGGGAPQRQGGGGGQGGTILVSRSASKTDPSLYEQAKVEAAKTGATVAFSE